ncbi:MAG: WecB/TagA/CpsF family glycosyltransferase [Candidatus Omnitrophica bacterium]|nr:WecB/TagA/CpsF family glycosyltransferase [Candidatus Omnitrophota bacterium]MBU1853070.1 WecB/TagA/CpsF family glycosyltransferase [Candidatus Omnitrophota bacterium]
MGRIKFLDVFIDNLSMQEVVGYIERFVNTKRPHQLVAVNAAKIVKMRQDRRLAELINSSDLIFADGQAVVSASRILGCSLKERVAGIDLMQELVKLALDRKYKLYFLGAKKEIVKKVVDIYKESLSRINILGWHHGYFSSQEEEKAVIEEIRRLKPDILFVAMGTPKKEYWIRDNLMYLGVPVCMGVGGSFDVIAGVLKRAPKWMQEIGMEWFFRFISEPRRLWKRYLVSNTVFIWLVFKEKCKVLLGWS